ncbi:terpene synthase family protein [Streptomyces sp. NBC_00249]|uniref:terpene synthase family protein n=1 Tax=Streptomyces sp. NBC_00249 TaxID=2975690 RepID=UPI00224CAADE|nr:terpene synthase family protein [Streptomyces sp. NBC_00249]MCX5192324.1 terpene synthase family protein [Streptomyces sp. NBC_00249]
MNDFLFDAANIINWQNDVVSLVKESNQHHVNNLVYILQNQNRCSLQEAVDTAYGMATGLNEKIFRAQRELPGMMDVFRLDDIERDHVQRWFDGVLLALGGCMEWQEITHNRKHAWSRPWWPPLSWYPCPLHLPTVLPTTSVSSKQCGTIPSASSTGSSNSPSRTSTR